VLTAHPTEVQRKSILDAERDIAQLLAARDDIRQRGRRPRQKGCATPRELAANEAHMRARVMQLWQTRLLRYSKLTVPDEVENALSYYESTFLREIPKLYAELEAAAGPAAGAQLPAHGPVDWRRPRRQPQRQRPHPGVRAAPPVRSGLAALPDGGALPGQRAVDFGHARPHAPPNCRPWPMRSPDRNAHRQDEPYRKALTGMYARLAATLQDAHGHRGRAPRRRPAKPLPACRRLRAPICAPLQHRCKPTMPVRWWRSACTPLMRAVEVFGFHLATVDLRQSSDKHEEVVAELLATARIEAHYPALDEAAKRKLLLRLLNDARSLRVHGRHGTRDHTAR